MATGTEARWYHRPRKLLYLSGQPQYHAELGSHVNLGILICKPSAQKIQEANLPLSILTPQGKNQTMSMEIQVFFLISERGELLNFCNMQSAGEI